MVDTAINPLCPISLESGLFMTDFEKMLLMMNIVFAAMLKELHSQVVRTPPENVGEFHPVNDEFVYCGDVV